MVKLIKPNYYNSYKKSWLFVAFKKKWNNTQEFRDKSNFSKRKTGFIFEVLNFFDIIKLIAKS